jgi:sugar-specific transcriptional regulator TrmB
MAFADENVLTLTNLGLTVAQAKVYLALAKSNNLKANMISKLSGVARSDVYRVINELEEDGFVARIISKPEEFHAVSIDECLCTLMQRRIDKTSQLAHKVRALSEKLRDKDMNEQFNEKCQFVLLPKRLPIYFRAEKMLSKVQECICFLGLTRRMTAWLSNYSLQVQEALKRKVDCRIIMPEAAEVQYLKEPYTSLWKYPHFELRLISRSPSSDFSIWDRKEILITTSVVDSAAPAPSLWSNNNSLVGLTQDYFGCIWADAKIIHLNSR